MNYTEFVENFGDEVTRRINLPSNLSVEEEVRIASYLECRTEWSARMLTDYFEGTKPVTTGTPEEEAIGPMRELQNALGELVGPDAKHFTFKGVLIAKPGTDLSLPVARLDVLESTRKLKQAQESITNIAQWVFANVCHQIALAQGVEVLNIGNEKVNRDANAALLTFRFFIDGKFKLSWRHHQEVAHMRWLDKVTKIELMKAIEKEDLSVSMMRKVARTMQARAKESGNPKSKQHATALVVAATAGAITICL